MIARCKLGVPVSADIDLESTYPIAIHNISDVCLFFTVRVRFPHTILSYSIIFFNQPHARTGFIALAFSLNHVESGLLRCDEALSH